MLKRYRGVLPLLALAAAASCRDAGPSGPDTSQLEMFVLQGDGQFGVPGSALPTPLTVRVQSVGMGKVYPGVTVRWELLQGSGGSLSPRSSLTDSSGVASTSLTLGSGLGTYRVRASVAGMAGTPVEFRADAILPPELSLVSLGPFRAGDTILLQGRNFSPDPAQSVVTFSRVRGRVVSATGTRLEVEVPACLPSRRVELRVQMGALASAGAAVDIQEGGEPLSLLVGEDRVLDPSDGLSCFRLPWDPNARYLVVPHSVGLVGGGRYDFALVGLTREERSPAPSPSHPAAPFRPVPSEALPRDEPGGDAQQRWDEWVRTLEGQILREMVAPLPPSPPPVPLAAARAPEVGERREFKVLNRENKFDKVSARLQHVSEKALVYLDEIVPAGGYASGDLAFLGRQFDFPIHPTVTSVFGQESDVDQNGRVIILLTPAVNRLTPPGSSGYVGGFFFGLDLLKGREGSNEGEIFYAVVPDPGGSVGRPLPREHVLADIPAILAHEFQHMVHFNQRMLVARAATQEALWLSEGLAQMAEDLVGVAIQQAGDPARAVQYQMGNWKRAGPFLRNPSQVSLIATLPPGTLEERGAGWLFLRYLHGHDREGTLLARLTRSTRSGADNVRAATFRLWESLVTDWAGSLYLDGLSVPVREELRVPGINLRDVLSRVDGTFPLNPPLLGPVTFLYEGSLLSSAPSYFVLVPDHPGGLAVNLSGPEGRPPDPGAGLRLLLVRAR